MQHGLRPTRKLADMDRAYNLSQAESSVTKAMPVSRFQRAHYQRDGDNDSV